MKYLDYFKNRIAKIKGTKKIAQEKNVSSSWWYGFIYGIASLFLLGSMLTFGIIILTSSIIVVTSLEGTIIETIAFDVMTVSVVIIPILFVFTLLDKMIILHLIIFQNINKALFYLWNRLDMWYFKKYRKHSPLTEGYSKLSDRTAKYSSKLSRSQKKMIKIALIMVLVGVQVYWKLPMFEELMIEINENNKEQLQSDSQIKPKLEWNQPKEKTLPELNIGVGR